jgi:hypothetical protein
MMHLFISLIVLLFVAVGGARAQCLEAAPQTVTLEGIIFSKDFPGPPNYQSIRSGDERMRYWILRLNKSVCVKRGYDDFLNTDIRNVREIQLVFMDDSLYARHRNLVRRRAHLRVIGSLYHQETGHHVTKILVNVKSVVPVRK